MAGFLAPKTDLEDTAPVKTAGGGKGFLAPKTDLESDVSNQYGMSDSVHFPGDEPGTARIDPMLGEIAGGMMGGAVAAPFALASAPSIVGPVAIEGAGVGFGAALGKKAVELFNEHVMGQRDERSGLARAVDTLGTFTGNAAMVPAGAALERGAGVASQVIQNGVRRFFGGGTEESASALKAFKQAITPPSMGGEAPSDSAVALQAFKQAGVTPTLGGIGGAEAKGVENALTKMPGGAGFMDKRLDQVRKDLTKSFGQVQEGMVQGMEPVTEMATAGEAAQRGAKDWVKGNMMMFEDAYKGLPHINKINVDIEPVQQLSKSILGDANKGLGDAATTRVANRMTNRADGTPRGKIVSFEEAVKMRSDLLDLAHSQDQEVAGQAQAAAQRLSGALNEAMHTSAGRAANAGEINAGEYGKFRDIQQRYAQFRDNLETVQQVSRSQTPEQAFKAVFSGANDGPTRLRVLKEALPEDAWDSLVSFKLGELPMEKATRGAGAERGFSPDQFLSNWRAIKSEESKTLLFGAKGEAKRDALDALANVVGRLKATQALSNPSGTAGQTQFMNWLSGGGTAAGVTLAATGHPLLGGLSVAAAIGAPAATRGTAKLMQSDRFLNWLAQGVKYSPANYQGMAQHITRLYGVVKAEPELRDAIQQYIDGVQLVTPNAGTQQKLAAQPGAKPYTPNIQASYGR